MCTCVLARCPQPRHHMRERVPKCALLCTLPLPRAGDMVPFAPAGRRHGAVAGCAMRASTPTNSMISAITLHHRLHCGWTRQQIATGPIQSRSAGTGSGPGDLERGGTCIAVLVRIPRLDRQNPRVQRDPTPRPSFRARAAPSSTPSSTPKAQRLAVTEAELSGVVGTSGASRGESPSAPGVRTAGAGDYAATASVLRRGDCVGGHW